MSSRNKTTDMAKRPDYQDFDTHTSMTSDERPKQLEEQYSKEQLPYQYEENMHDRDSIASRTRSKQSKNYIDESSLPREEISRKQTKEWVASASKSTHDEDDDDNSIKPDDSISVKGSNIASSITSSTVKRAKIRELELAAQAEFVRRKNEYEAQRSQLRRDIEDEEAREEIEAAVRKMDEELRLIKERSNRDRRRRELEREEEDIRRKEQEIMIQTELKTAEAVSQWYESASITMRDKDRTPSCSEANASSMPARINPKNITSELNEQFEANKVCHEIKTTSKDYDGEKQPSNITSLSHPLTSMAKTTSKDYDGEKQPSNITSLSHPLTSMAKTTSKDYDGEKQPSNIHGLSHPLTSMATTEKHQSTNLEKDEITTVSAVHVQEPMYGETYMYQPSTVNRSQLQHVQPRTEDYQYQPAESSRIKSQSHSLSHPLTSMATTEKHQSTNLEKDKITPVSAVYVQEPMYGGNYMYQPSTVNRSQLQHVQQRTEDYQYQPAESSRIEPQSRSCKTSTTHAPVPVQIKHPGYQPPATNSKVQQPPLISYKDAVNSTAQQPPLSRYKEPTNYSEPQPWNSRTSNMTSVKNNYTCSKVTTMDSEARQPTNSYMYGRLPVNEEIQPPFNEHDMATKDSEPLHVEHQTLNSCNTTTMKDSHKMTTNSHAQQPWNSYMCDRLTVNSEMQRPFNRHDMEAVNSEQPLDSHNNMTPMNSFKATAMKSGKQQPLSYDTVTTMNRDPNLQETNSYMYMYDRDLNTCRTVPNHQQMNYATYQSEAGNSKTHQQSNRSQPAAVKGEFQIPRSGCEMFLVNRAQDQQNQMTSQQIPAALGGQDQQQIQGYYPAAVKTSQDYNSVSSQQMPAVNINQFQHPIHSFQPVAVNNSQESAVTVSREAPQLNCQPIVTGAIQPPCQLPSPNSGQANRQNTMTVDGSKQQLRPDQTLMNPFQPQYVPVVNNNQPAAASASNSDQTTMLLILQQLVNLQQQAALPAPDLEYFDGRDVLLYPAFMKNFKTLVEDSTQNYAKRLEMLIKYTRGEARKLIKDCVMIEDPRKAYEAALGLMQGNYGHPATLAATYKLNADTWPSIKSGDKEALRKYSVFLTGLINARSGTPDLDSIDGFEFLKTLAGKLPVPLQQQWIGIVGRCREEQFRAPKIEDFARFITRLSRDMNDPRIAGLGYQKRNDNDKGQNNNQAKWTSKRSAFATTVDQPRNATQPQTRGGTNKNKGTHQQKNNSDSKAKEIQPCLYCGPGTKHNITECRKFGALQPDEKSQYCRDKELCYGCLKPGHSKKKCWKPESCNHCSKPHPTSLHNQRQETSKQENKEKEVITGCVGVNQQDTNPLMAIIPVLVKTNNSERAIATFAFLDNGCGAVFATEELQMNMNMQTKNTKLLIKTMNLEQVMKTKVIQGNLQVGNIDGSTFIDMPTVYVKQQLPVETKDIPTQEDLDKWSHLHNMKLPELPDNYEQIPKISLMIGGNVPAATMPMKTIAGNIGEPYAVCSPLGWIVYGLPGKLNSQSTNVHFCRIDSATVQDSTEHLEQQFKNYVNFEFNERQSEERSLSVEDKQFLEIMDKTVEKTPDGHYKTALPFRNRNREMPNNRDMAMAYTQQLKKKLLKDSHLHEQYNKFMTDLEEKSYAERIPQKDKDSTDKRVWYIPHHSVHNPKKPEKVRVVFNCPVKYKGTSINDELLQGPDMTNKLLGVMLRWRREPIAMMADIESMFYQVQVQNQDCDMLRYLWWPRGNLNEEPVDYRMLVHIFGAVSSPSCANYALRRTAMDSSHKYGEEVKKSILSDFYVDDMLKSVPEEDEAITMAQKIRDALSEGGFRLTKWISNSEKMLQSIPDVDRAKEMKNLDPERETMHRALGVHWYVDTDQLGFALNDVNGIATRRNILSVMSSIYDPLGMSAPYVFQAKNLLQSLCKQKISWDEEIQGAEQQVWEKWLKELPKLSQLKVDRCLKPTNYGTPVNMQLHHFADASEIGYGIVSYIRYINEKGQVHCAFILAKSRVAPLKQVSIPRLELNAATLAVRVNQMLQKELEMPFQETHYWTDSQTVLRYINNESARYHTYVANRVEFIRDGSQMSQWHYVESKENPADDTSRGLTMDHLLQSCRWFQGPAFLWKQESHWPAWPPSQDPDLETLVKDPEVKTVSINTSVVKNLQQEVNKEENKQTTDPVHQMIIHYSDWLALNRAVAWWMRLKKVLRLKSRGQEDPPRSKYLSVDEIQSAEEVIIQKVQKEAFPEEMKALTKLSKPEPDKSTNGDDNSSQHPYVHTKIDISSRSPLLHLNPIMSHGLLRVGGRLQNAPISDESKHQLILPRHHHVVELLLRHLHQRCGHQGRNHVLSELRKKYWIIKAGTAVKSMLRKCVICKRQNARATIQMMANLPSSRVKPEVPPFTYTGMDFFGPFEIKQGRSLKKRYGVLFTCMSSRAIHIEIAECMDTSSCINALRRFISRRGPVKEITSDNGTNLVGANHELRQAIQELKEPEINKFAANLGIKWKFNIPAASHHGGVWERQIRTVRKILQALLAEQHLRVTRNEEQLHTLLCEVEAMVNNRPLTKVSADTEDLDVITPNHLLQLKTPENFPPGNFVEQDQYARRRWRQVQYIADVFWKRWTHEYLPELQKRQKWLKPKKNIKVGDIVLVIDDKAPRNSWLMGLVQKCHEDKNGLVRSVQLKTKTATLKRPVSKLCVLLEQEE